MFSGFAFVQRGYAIFPHQFVILVIIIQSLDILTPEEIVSKVRHSAGVNAVRDEEDHHRARCLQRRVGPQKDGDQNDQKFTEQNDLAPVVVSWFKPIV